MESDASEPVTLISVRRVRLNRGGYASDGRYFGVGAPLYLATSEDPQAPRPLYPQSYYSGGWWFRANDRADAVARVLEHWRSCNPKVIGRQR